MDKVIQRTVAFVGSLPKEDRYRLLSFPFLLSSQKKQRHIKGPVPLEPSHYFRFRYGRTACTRRRVYLHRASIAVSKPTPHDHIPGVGLPLSTPTTLLPYEVRLWYENCEPSES